MIDDCRSPEAPIACEAPFEVVPASQLAAVPRQRNHLVGIGVCPPDLWHLEELVLSNVVAANKEAKLQLSLENVMKNKIKD
jgi:hypothetical protein